MNRPDLTTDNEAMLLVVVQADDYDTTAARLLQALENVPGADLCEVGTMCGALCHVTVGPPIETKHLPVGWDDDIPLDCEDCGAPWPCAGWNEADLANLPKLDVRDAGLDG